MASYLPTYLTSARSTFNAPSASESVTYDYSGQDEILKRQDEARKLELGRYQQLYGGDVAGSVASGQRIRDLLASIKSIEPVRIASRSSSADGGGSSSAVEGDREDPAPAPQMLPPNRMRSGVRAKAMSNSIAGNPKGFGNDGRQLGTQYA